MMSNVIEIELKESQPALNSQLMPTYIGRRFDRSQFEQCSKTIDIKIEEVSDLLHVGTSLYQKIAVCLLEKKQAREKTLAKLESIRNQITRFRSNQKQQERAEEIIQSCGGIFAFLPKGRIESGYLSGNKNSIQIAINLVQTVTDTREISLFSQLTERESQLTSKLQFLLHQLECVLMSLNSFLGDHDVVLATLITASRFDHLEQNKLHNLIRGLLTSGLYNRFETPEVFDTREEWDPATTKFNEILKQVANANQNDPIGLTHFRKLILKQKHMELATWSSNRARLLSQLFTNSGGMNAALEETTPHYHLFQVIAFWISDNSDAIKIMNENFNSLQSEILGIEMAISDIDRTFYPLGCSNQ